MFELDLSPYRTWVNRSVTLDFYPSSMALAVNEAGLSILIVEGLHDLGRPQSLDFSYCTVS